MYLREKWLAEETEATYPPAAPHSSVLPRADEQVTDGTRATYMTSMDKLTQQVTNRENKTR